METELGERFKREGAFVYLRLINVDVWQKATQYCKAIILQLKKKFKEQKSYSFTSITTMELDKKSVIYEK